MRALFILSLGVMLLSVSRAGVQQDFFASAVQKAARVRIAKIGPDKTATGALCQHVLLDSAERKKIEEVASAIEMIDPKPEKRGTEEDVWVGSALSFGVAEYVVEFFETDQPSVRYGMSSSMTFITPLGAHAPQGTQLLLDYSLTGASAQKIKKLIGSLTGSPNHAADRMPGSNAPGQSGRH